MMLRDVSNTATAEDLLCSRPWRWWEGEAAPGWKLAPAAHESAAHRSSACAEQCRASVRRAAEAQSASIECVDC